MAVSSVRPSRKTNKDFMILSALGILFVVDSHLGSGIFPFTQIFPYDSFFMPMFAFISGYFFAPGAIGTWGDVVHFGLRKAKKLLFPYFFWMLFYAAVTTLGRLLGFWQIGDISLLDLIDNIVNSGTSFFFNDPAWFVPLLFCVSVSYSILRKLFGRRWNDTAALILLALAGAAAVALSQTGYRQRLGYMVLKVSVFLQYYHLAVVFRKKWEHGFDKAGLLSVCIPAAVINCVLLAIFGYDMSFPLYATMDGFQPACPFLPLLTSVTGIAFWLKIAKALVPLLGENPLVNFISDNTAFFMTHHLLVKHVFLGLLLLAQRLGATCFPGLDAQGWQMYAWYNYTDLPWCNALCFLFTVSLLTLWCKAWKKLPFSQIIG